ncbi:MAG: lipid-A-disaccharide synthase N-terminal domain-containing protein [Phycisphaerales bacterium]|nr:lipid-A-disaccharide synthase N-terminal domain-containing protein [Phycisphaerales bacterium]
MKSGPVLAMVALLFVGMWLVLQPSLARPRGQMVTRIGAVEVLSIQRPAGGDERAGSATGPFEYQVVNRPELGDRWISGEEFQTLLRGEWQAWQSRPAFERGLLGFFNITSWANFAWIAIGLAGQIAFFGRMLVQWVVSEKRRESVVPTLFWWLSLGGGVCLFAYFVWRVDFVGVLGQSTGIVIYARNLRLIKKQKRRSARLAAEDAGAKGKPADGLGNEIPDPDADPAPEPTGIEAGRA